MQKALIADESPVAQRDQRHHGCHRYAYLCVISLLVSRIPMALATHRDYRCRATRWTTSLPRSQATTVLSILFSYCDKTLNSFDTFQRQIRDL